MQLSRSPSVVSVALQLPENEAHGLQGGRLIEKYPSSTTLWLILRNFESLAPHRNYTQRAKTRTENGEVGAGRLYHEAPVLSIMGRELTSFTDLQKTLAQLGFNGGSVLLRLGFRISNTPLEEAMEQIDQYFKSVQGESMAGAHATSMTTSETVPDIVEPVLPGKDDDTEYPSEPLSPTSDDLRPTVSQQVTESPVPEEAPLPLATATNPGQWPMTVFKPSLSSTPHAAQQISREADFEPTIHQAKLHQARLQKEGRNKTLLSDKELAEKENTKAQKLAEIKEIRIRVRLPDQSMLERTFSNLDTAQTLYDTVKESLHNENEPFMLRFTSDNGSTRTIPQGSTERLVSELGMSGKTLVSFLWGDAASVKSRATPVLKQHLREQAVEIKVPDAPEVDVAEEPAENSNTGKRLGNNSSEGKMGRPKWAKNLFKK